MFLARNDVGSLLPAVIEPWDDTTFCFNVENFPEIDELYVRTADGREWYCSRTDIRQIREHKLYKAARTAPPEKNASA
jgi:hypothetical protein